MTLVVHCSKIAGYEVIWVEPIDRTWDRARVRARWTWNGEGDWITMLAPSVPPALRPTPAPT